MHQAYFCTHRSKQYTTFYFLKISSLARYLLGYKNLFVVYWQIRDFGFTNETEITKNAAISPHMGHKNNNEGFTRVQYYF